MEIKYGSGKTKFGPGVNIDLSGDEIAIAIAAYLVSHNIHINGPRTITVNGGFIQNGKVYVDPSGFVIVDGIKYLGNGT